MMVTKDMMMDVDPKSRRAPGMMWPIVIGIGTAMLAGGFAGFSKAAADHGDAALAPWIGPVIAIALGIAAMAFYFRRHADWFKTWSPRKRLYWVSTFLAGALGMVSAIMLQSTGDGAMFSDTPLSPRLAIALSLFWGVGLSIAVFFYHRSADDHDMYAYNLGARAGFYAFAVPCPVWWLLARADLAPPVEAMPLFIFAMCVNAVAYFWYKFR